MDVFYDLQNYNNQNSLPLDQLKYNKSKNNYFILKNIASLYLKWTAERFLTLCVSLH